MKKLILAFSTLIFFAACTNAPKTAQEAQEVKSATESAHTFSVDLAASSVNWEGAKITQTVHHGIINISEGVLAVHNGELEAGSFVIDMNSIQDIDLEDEGYRAKLEGHLKSADFFDVESYPTARFEITEVEKNEDGSTQISGNLTIKDITKGISFPAMVSVSDSGVEASAAFQINRNEWDVVWGGSKTEQSIKEMLQNNLIKDEISFEVNIKTAE